MGMPTWASLTGVPNYTLPKGTKLETDELIHIIGVKAAFFMSPYCWGDVWIVFTLLYKLGGVLHNLTGPRFFQTRGRNKAF